MSAQTASVLVSALELIWTSVRRHHRELPDVVVIVGPGHHGTKRIWGHFAPERWSRKARTAAAEAPVERVHEVLLAGESLEREPALTVATLLHEAGHALAEARGVKDTSRRGAYHNKKFKLFAEEVGLAVAKHERLGWTITTARPETLVRYEREIESLRVAQEQTRHARREWGDEKPKATRSRTTWVCACVDPEPRTFPMSARVMERAAIVCAACETEFKKQEA